MQEGEVKGHLGESARGAGEDGARWGRPGRVAAEVKRDAVLELIAGKATAEQLARRIGVLPETVEAWRQEAVEALAVVFRNSGKTPRERELERENKELREALARQSIKVALYEKKVPHAPGGAPRSMKMGTRSE
ncbi:MAG: transposase [Limnochordaceae bacterium]|nr:transposase [Limnochordaceae bacterium]